MFPVLCVVRRCVHRVSIIMKGAASVLNVSPCPHSLRRPHFNTLSSLPLSENTTAFLAIPIISFANTSLTSPWLEATAPTSSPPPVAERTYTLQKTTECRGNFTCTDIDSSRSPASGFAFGTLNVMGAAQLGLIVLYLRLRLDRLKDGRPFMSREICPGTFPILAAVSGLSFFLAVLGLVVATLHFNEEEASLVDWDVIKGWGFLSAFLNIFVSLLSAFLTCGLALWFRGAPLVGTWCGEVARAPLPVPRSGRGESTTERLPAANEP
jgi:hypothetical protein